MRSAEEGRHQPPKADKERRSEPIPTPNVTPNVQASWQGVKDFFIPPPSRFWRNLVGVSVLEPQSPTSESCLIVELNLSEGGGTH